MKPNIINEDYLQKAMRQARKLGLPENIEIRTWPGKVALRAQGDDGDGDKVLEGYAAVFNVWSEGLWFQEKIEPGAFSESIKEDDVVALFNHDPNLVLGRTSAETLELKEDKIGLFYNVTLPNSRTGEDLYVSVERGDVKGSSFGFITLEDKWEYPDGDDGDVMRTILKARLYDVSPATYPAYPDTTVAARSLDRWLKEEKAANSTWRREIARRRLELAALD